MMNYPVHILLSKKFASRSFRRASAKIRLAQKFFQQWLVDPPSRCNCTISVERLLEQYLGEPIENHIGRPRIEGHLGFALGRKHSQIGYTTQIQYTTGDTILSKQDLICKSDERCSLSANSKIRWAKIRNHRYIRPGGNYRRFTQLQCSTRWLPPQVGFVRSMPNGLSM